MLVGGAVVLRPLAGRAQQPAIPVVGFLDSSSADVFETFVAAFRKGLREIGFVEGGNVRIEYRWAEGHYDRLPGLAAELVRIPVAVLAATGVTAALAAKASTRTIPVVFHTGGDPVEFGYRSATRSVALTGRSRRGFVRSIPTRSARRPRTPCSSSRSRSSTSAVRYRSDWRYST